MAEQGLELEPQETQAQSLGGEDPLEKEMAIHCGIFALEDPWAEEPGGLQSMKPERILPDGAPRHDEQTRVWLLYSVTFVSAVEQREPATHVHPAPLIWIPSRVGDHSALSSLSCVVGSH